MAIDFGPHQGEQWTRVPISYLRWLITTDHAKAGVAKKEIKRRGIRYGVDAVDISKHAIDRASLYSWEIFQAERLNQEGLYSWLMRISEAALKTAPPNRPFTFKYQHKTMLLVFALNRGNTVLVTVMKR